MTAIAGLPLESIGVLVAFILTLMVFSYLLGDNPLYRLAQHVLVGVVAGYAIVIAYHSILRPRLLEPLISNPTANATLIAPLLLAVLLLTKGRRSLAWLGNTSMGYLFGVGGALAIGGALLGSLATQLQASWGGLPASASSASAGLNILSGFLLILGTTGTLMYFYYNVAGGSKLSRGMAGIRLVWGRIGRWFILIALGAIFATLMVSRLSLLIGRIRFLLDTLSTWIG